MKENIIKGLIFSIKTKLSKKILTLLSILNIVPKNEINFFTSNINILKNIEKSRIKQFLYKMELLYSKKIILVNSRTHDFFFEQKIDISEESQITYLDNLDHEFKVSFRGNLKEEHIKRYYNNVLKFLNDISKIFGKK